MKVTVSVGGRWHGFDLAAQLQKRSALQRLITSYPKSRTRAWGIDDAKVISLIAKEVLERGWKKLPRPLRTLWDPQWCAHELFDAQAARRIPQDTDIFVGWSSLALQSLRRAKQYGARAVLEHGSSHILRQDELLRQEYEQWGAQGELPHPGLIEKELHEYDEADRIAIPSLFVERSFIEAGVPREKLMRIPYGVDLSHFRQVPKQDTIFRVIFAGTLCLRKGVPYLLQAFSELKLKNAELVLYGAVSPEIEPIIRRYQDNAIRFERVAHAELYQHYSQGSVFVLPSVEEGLARVLFEAMACGLPVIATPNTGAEDIAQDGTHGFIVPVRDVGALKQKILYCYEHQDETRAMGQNAKQKVARGFTWDDYGDKVMAAYQSIVDISHGQ